MLLSRLVTSYDMKLLSDDGAVPPPRLIGLIMIPDMKAKVLFKRHGEEEY